MAPHGPFLPLGTVRQLSGKIVHAWAFEGDCDPACLVSIAATTEWPPRSGRYIDVPEIDRARFFPIDEARDAMNVGQVALARPAAGGSGRVLTRTAPRGGVRRQPTWMRGRRSGIGSACRSTSRHTGAVSPSPNARNFSR